MTRKETLERIADELRCNVDNHLDVALLSIVEMLAEMSDKQNNISWSCGNIGIDVMSDCIELVDLETGEVLLILTKTYVGGRL